MRTHADADPSLLDPRSLVRMPEWLAGNVWAAGRRFVQDTSAVLAAIHAIPRLVVALEQLGPATDAVTALAHARTELDQLARNARSAPPTLGQLRALHEQIVLVACDLRALESEIESLASFTASLDRSVDELADVLAAERADPTP